jgi:hypothetical protein
LIFAKGVTDLYTFYQRGNYDELPPPAYPHLCRAFHYAVASFLVEQESQEIDKLQKEVEAQKNAARGGAMAPNVHR